MKVFVVVQGYDYEPADVYGVYATKEKAVESIKEIESLIKEVEPEFYRDVYVVNDKECVSGCYYDIQEWEVAE